MFGCAKKSGRKAFYCHNNNMWILMEDWMVEFAQNTLRIDKSEVELRNAINAFKDLGDEDIKVAYSMKKMAEEFKNKSKNKGQKIVSEQTANITEEFTVLNKKNKYIEENFILDKGFDMSEVDKVTSNFNNFKNVINEVKKNTKDNYDNQASDSEELERQAEEAKDK